MDHRVLAFGLTAVLFGAGALAWAQSATSEPTPAAPGDSTTAAPADQPPPPDNTQPEAQPPAETAAPATSGQVASPTTPPPATPPGQTAAAPAIPTGPPPVPPNAVLVLTGLDKITGRPTRLVARLNQPVRFATLTITARYCYSTPASETPETSAFLQVDDHRPDQAERRVFSGWMYASSPGLNAMQHPLYDVWVISCSANAPGQTPPTVASAAPVKVRSPDATDSEGVAPLPEGAGQ